MDVEAQSRPQGGIPTVAIVGRPNVGKSALFNKILRRRVAIVHEEPGVTRDRIITGGEWYGKRFMLIDTGGLGIFKGEHGHKPFDAVIRDQMDAAVTAADIVLFVVDVISGLVPMDFEVGQLLREEGKRVVIAANKADNPKLADAAAEIALLGFEDVIPISCMHNQNIDELLDRVTADFIAADAKEEMAANIAIVGRPNVGKSSIVNHLIEEDRVIVSAIPGTTRDAVDVPVTLSAHGHALRLNLIDTAGIGRKRAVKSAVDFFSLTRTMKAIRRAEIVCVVLDATSPVSTLDKKICRMVMDERKACVLLANKWDLACRQIKQKTLYEEIANEIPYLEYVPVLTCCALSGYNFGQLTEVISMLQGKLSQSFPTPLVNRIINDITTRSPPQMIGSRLFKIYYSIHKTGSPHTFLLFVNKISLCPRNYVVFLQKQLRRAFDLTGMPIEIQFSEKDSSRKRGRG